MYRNRERKMHGILQKGRLIGLCLACSGLLAACGDSGNRIQVEISDGYEHSSFDAEPGRTVRQLLEEAEIQVDAKDKVQPGLDETVSADLDIEILRSHEVVVDYGDADSVAVTLQGGNVGDAIAKAGIELDDSMAVNLDLDRYLSDGLDIVVSKLALVKVKADGQVYEEFTDAKNVRGLLSELGIQLGRHDRTSKRLDDPIVDGMKLKVQRVAVKKETEQEEIPFETKEERTDNLDAGTTQVQQNGETGLKKLTYRVVYVDGVEESRRLQKEKVVKDPVDEVVLVGTRQKEAVPSNPPTAGTNSGQSGASGTNSGQSGASGTNSGQSGASGTNGGQSGASGTNGGQSGTSGENGGSGGRTIVSVQDLDDCDGSGHGVRITKYSDGTEEVVEY